MEKIVVDLDNVRLDAYIAKKREDLSRVMVQKLIENGKVLVDGKKRKISYKVQVGEVIELDIPEAKETGVKAEDIPLDIVYEDEDIIVVNKPKGMVVHPANCLLYTSRASRCNVYS